MYTVIYLLLETFFESAYYERFCVNQVHFVYEWLRTEVTIQWRYPAERMQTMMVGAHKKGIKPKLSFDYHL